MDQNREGLIMIRLEELSIESLESVAPQLHFLLKTRIFVDWLQISERGEEMFWKKLRRALGFTNYGPYGTVKQYYQNYWFKRNGTSDRIRSKLRAITAGESNALTEVTGAETTGKRVESRDFLVPSIRITSVPDDADSEAVDKPYPQKLTKNNGTQLSRKRAAGILETCIRMKDLEKRMDRDEEEAASETGSKASIPEDSAISSDGMTSRTISIDEDDDEDEEAVFGDVEDEESTSGCESSTSSLHRDRMFRRKMAVSSMLSASQADQNNNQCATAEPDEGGKEPANKKPASKRTFEAGRKLKIPIIEEG